MHKIWENWLEALRIGGPGENLLHPSLPLQRGVGGGGALERMERELLTRVPRPKALSTQPRLSKIWKERQMVQKFPGKVSRNSRNCWISKMLTIQLIIPAAKMNGKKTSRKKISKIWVYLPKFVLFIENFGTCCSICYWKLTKIQSWRFGWMERAPKTLLQLAE